jgi:hypothetical protein
MLYISKNLDDQKKKSNCENFKIEEPLHQFKTFMVFKWFPLFSNCVTNWENDLKSFPKIVKPFLKNKKPKTLKHSLTHIQQIRRF